MIKKLLYLPSLLLGIFLFSCQKDEKTEPVPDVANASALDPFFEHYRPGKQTFQVNTQTPSSFTGQQGTEINFGPHSFPPGVGSQVEIELIEVYSRGDLLLMRKPTVNRGRVLQTAGQIYLRMLQQGNQLEIVQAEMRLPLVDSLPSNGQMEIFVQTAPGRYGFNWARPVGADSTAVTYFAADSLGTFGPHYRVALRNDTLGWRNISHVFNQPSAGRAINGKIHGLENYDGFVMYCVYKSIRAVSPFKVYVNGQFSSNISLPDEQNVKLVAIGKQDGRFYYGHIDFLSGPKVTAPEFGVEEISEADLIHLIRNL